ncbi:MAG: hypothetical protein AAF576_01360, partial [Pseudomonadota bacterium]
RIEIQKKRLVHVACNDGAKTVVNIGQLANEAHEIIEIAQLSAAKLTGGAIQNFGRRATGADMNAATPNRKTEILYKARQVDPLRRAINRGFHHGLREAHPRVRTEFRTGLDHALGQRRGALCHAGFGQNIKGGLHDLIKARGVKRPVPTALRRRCHLRVLYVGL